MRSFLRRFLSCILSYWGVVLILNSFYVGVIVHNYHLCDEVRYK